ncbi:MAG: hypothetical protein ACQESV_04285 [Thermodesulfobacteriota bacterium]
MLVVGKALDKMENCSRKYELDPMAAMLSRLGKRGCHVREGQAAYSVDSEPDAISIPKKKNPNKRMHWTLIIRASDPKR